MRVLFAIFVLSFVSQSVYATDCRSEIKNKIFIRDFDSQDPKSTSNPIYITPFIEAYDLFPQPVRDYFCQIKQIILQPMEASANSNYEFRRGPFEKQMKVDQWATWKEQLNFGAKNDENYKTVVGFPVISTTLPANTTFLYFLLLHEMSHNLERGEDQSWVKMYQDPNNSYPYKSGLCSYFCKDVYLNQEQMNQVYEDTYERSNYLSLYATRNLREDYADSLAFYIMIEVSGYDYQVTNVANNRVMDVRTKLKSPIFAKKREYLAETYRQLEQGNLKPLPLLRVPIL